MHQNAERVAAALRAASADGAADGIRELADSARTALEAADALGVPVGAIVKSLVFLADGAPILVLASGDHQVDTAKVAAVLGVGSVRRTDADLVREATGFPIGGVAPVGHPSALRTVIDEHLDDFAVVWAAAGTPHAVFPTSYTELVRVSGGVSADVSAQS